MNPGPDGTEPGGPTELRTIAETDWQPFTLFGGAVRTYHSPSTRTWTCENGQDETACKGTGAHLRKTRSVWIAKSTRMAGGGPPLLYVEEQTYLQDSVAYDAGDRRTFEGYWVWADASTYRVQYYLHAALASHGGPASQDDWTDYQNWTFDADYRVPMSHSQFVDLDGNGSPSYATRLITTWNYDWTTGVKTLTRTPRHYPSGPAEQYTYDADQRFVLATTDEVGHSVEHTYEPGTGAVLSAKGPSSSSCGTGCTNWEMTWTDVDGLGRPLATWVNVPPPFGQLTDPWVKTQSSRTTYVDSINPATNLPTNVRVENRIEYDEDRWSSETTYVDGRGRPIQVLTESDQGSFSTLFDYDVRGLMVAATLPDPSQSDPMATVTYLYGYDSLGRPTSMRRPGAGGGPDSGVDVSYDGLVETRQEVTGTLGGNPAKTSLLRDVYGRLVEVDEYLDATSFAATHYTYDPRDAVTHIDSPDGVGTDLVHDFAGRRIRIERANASQQSPRTWSYTYDKNGNLIAEAAPPPDLLVASDYITTFTYDAADRLATRVVGTRELTDPGDQTLLGVGTITFDYDTCDNGVGRLCTATFPDGVLTQSYSYDAEGNAASETRTFDFGGVTGTRTMSTTFGAGGHVRVHTYADAAPSGYPTTSRVTYDRRGLPVSMFWIDPSSNEQEVARQTRNLAGLVTRRETALNQPGAHAFASDFTYDQLTRVTQQTVWDLSVARMIAAQTLDYFGNDDPSRLRHQIDPSIYYDLAFSYDARHQLAGVTEAASQFAADYYHSDGGRLERVNLNAAGAPGSDVVNRDVDYQYNSSVDPEAVSALTPHAGGANLRDYTYDSVGGLATRSGGATTDTFLYDGDDQLRRASVSGGGTEEYYYDHGGQRAAVVSRDGGGAITDVRVFFGDTEVILDPSGAQTKSYAHLSLGTPVGRVADGTDLELQYHGLASNTLASVAADGTVVANFVYAPYGELLHAEGTNLSEQHRRFNDKYKDDLTSLSYYGVRYYDGLSLSWTQADPQYRFAPDAAWADPRRADLYLFSLNNPVRYVDPDGRQPAAGTLGTAAAEGEGAGPVGVVVAVAIWIGIEGSGIPDELPPSMTHGDGRPFRQMAGKAFVAAFAAAMAKAKSATDVGSKADAGPTDIAPPLPPPPPCQPDYPGKKRKGPKGNDGTMGGKNRHGGDAHNGAIDKRIEELKNDDTVSDIRKGQTQVDVNGDRVGDNMPDVQYNKDGIHHVEEYDTRSSGGHGDRIRCNDPDAHVREIPVPEPD